MLDRLLCDVTVVLMGLRVSRGLLAIAVLTLAGGIGMNAAMVGLVDRRVACGRRSVRGIRARGRPAETRVRHPDRPRRHAVRHPGADLRGAALLTRAAATAGCLGAVIAGRSLQSLLSGIVAADPVVLGGATAIMIAVALCATLLPARAAARCDPNALLQAE